LAWLTLKEKTMLSKPPIDPSQTPSSLFLFVRQNWNISTPLTILTVTCSIVAVLALFGVLADPRQVLGQPVWAKTTKFAISFGLYGASMTWMLGMLKTRASKIAGGIIASMLMLEIGLIITQAIRGRAIHFNVATPLDNTLWNIMSVGIFVFLLAAIIATILLLRVKLESRVLKWSLSLGLILTLIGLLQGFTMTSENALQTKALKAGRQINFAGAHTVNAIQDGGPGIPFLGWSTDHGDLRIGHFIGIHGLQVIPLLGFFLMRRRSSWLLENHRVGLVFIAAFGYLGFAALVTWQALRDQSIISPDALTLQVFAGIVSIIVFSSLGVVAHARRKLRA
jgi:hypothetical protein